MHYPIMLAIAGVTLMTIGSGCGQADDGVPQQRSALRFTMTALDGREVDLARYAGKVLLVVNVASKCGYTPQYEQLQALHEKYADQGLAVLGFPCNQFLWQEPGSAEEIRQFCRVNYGVTFDMFAKIDVKGKNASEFYRFLTSLDTKPKGAGKISWNFEKFVIDRNGFVVARFGPATKPDDPEIVAVIERELAKPPRESDTEQVAGSAEHPFKLEDYRWQRRLLLLFAPAADEPRYREFQRRWTARHDEVAERDLLLITVLERGESRVGKSTLSAAAAARLRKRFRSEPGSTLFVLIGKDGTEKLRRSKLELDELFAVIDAMPMRRREMKRQDQSS